MSSKSNPLDEVKTAKRKLKGIHFDFEGAEVSYTDASVGGAASGMNDPILLKQASLNEAQKEILESIEEDYSPMNKSNESSKDKGNDDIMNEELKKELDALKKELAVAKAEKKVLKYSFEKELEAGLVEAMAGLNAEQQEVVVKAMDALLAGKEAAEAEVEKSAKKEEENPLQKALEKEAGFDVQAEPAKEMSVLEKIKKAREEQLNKGAK